jgi:alanine-synthesizing transaminase
MKNRFHFHRFDQLPPYVFAEVTGLMIEGRRAGEDVIDLGMGNPDLPTPVHIVEKIRDVAHNPRTHRYSSSRGIPHLRAAICERYARRHNVALDAERGAIALIGSKEGLARGATEPVAAGIQAISPG